MRVLFVLPRMVAGGVERASLNLIAGLQRQGVDCRLALGQCHGELLDEARQLVPVDEVAGRSKWLFVFGLLRAVRRYRPTHIVTAFADVSLMVLVARWLVCSDAAVIVGVHGTQQKAAAMGGARVQFQYWLHGWLACYVYRLCDALVAVSRGVADDVLERHPRVAARLQVIHNPVLTTVMQQRILDLPGRTAPRPPYRLVAVGRLAYEKGFDVLLEAMPSVAASFEVRLGIYGEGAERKRLQAMVDALGLQQCVELMGTTLDPLAAIHAADLFVFPSRHEGFGVALVEALACGQQIVASDCPHGPAEILQAGALGQLVSPGDPAGLARAIGRSLGGQVHFPPESLRLRAREFTADAAVAGYLALLRKLARATDGHC